METIRTEHDILNELASRILKLESRLDGIDEVELPIQIDSDEVMPIYANPTDAGADLVSNEEIRLMPGETKIIKTGIKVAIPEGYEIQIRPRSGLSVKTYLRVANAPGTIDTGYRDEIGIIISADDSFVNHKKANKSECYIDGSTSENSTANNAIIIRKGDRIAQMVLNKICKAKFIKVDDVSVIGTNRGGGFGSTGTS